MIHNNWIVYGGLMGQQGYQTQEYLAVDTIVTNIQGSAVPPKASCTSSGVTSNWCQLSVNINYQRRHSCAFGVRGNSLLIFGGMDGTGERYGSLLELNMGSSSALPNALSSATSDVLPYISAPTKAPTSSVTTRPPTHRSTAATREPTRPVTRPPTYYSGGSYSAAEDLASKKTIKVILGTVIPLAFAILLCVLRCLFGSAYLTLVCCGRITLIKPSPHAFSAPVVYDFHAAHECDDGENSHGFKCHERVKSVVNALRLDGYSVWFDEKCRAGDVDEKMKQGLASSKVVLLFLTEHYLTKCGYREAEADVNDWCYREYQEVLKSHGESQSIFPVFLNSAAEALKPKLKEKLKYRNSVSLTSTAEDCAFSIVIRVSLIAPSGVKLAVGQAALPNTFMGMVLDLGKDTAKGAVKEVAKEAGVQAMVAAVEPDGPELEQITADEESGPVKNTSMLASFFDD